MTEISLLTEGYGCNWILYMLYLAQIIVTANEHEKGKAMFTYEEIRSFNELEMSVYNYIIQNKEKIAYMKIRQLAEEAHVSTTTVLRFCKKAGCEGYSEFKLKFKLYLQEDQEKQPDLDISMLMDYLKRAETKEYQESMEKALKILTASTSIVFVGSGTSGVLGRYGARFFNNVGWFSLCIDDPFTPVYQGESVSTVIVALSVSGDTSETLRLATQLKNRGCQLISITNSASCPLALLSDCNLNYYIPEVKLECHLDITSQIPVMFLIETLGRRLKGMKK